MLPKSYVLYVCTFPHRHQGPAKPRAHASCTGRHYCETPSAPSPGPTSGSRRPRHQPKPMTNVKEPAARRRRPVRATSRFQAASPRARESFLLPTNSGTQSPAVARTTNGAPDLRGSCSWFCVPVFWLRHGAIPASPSPLPSSELPFLLNFWAFWRRATAPPRSSASPAGSDTAALSLQIWSGPAHCTVSSASPGLVARRRRFPSLMTTAHKYESATSVSISF